MKNGGFNEVLDRWRNGDRSLDADLAETGLGQLHLKYPQVVENLAQDPQISLSKREELLGQLVLVDVNDASLVEDRLFRFCRSHQCQGRRNDTAEQANLGHVEKRGKFEATIASSMHAKSGVTRRRRAVGLFVDAILSRNADDQRALLCGCLLSRWLMWSFYQSRHLEQAFAEVSRNRADLIRRLGLGSANSNDEFVIWTHRLRPGQRAHTPTAFDAEAYEWFRPGGKTKALAGDDGLSEVVHGPVSSDQLIERIERAS